MDAPLIARELREHGRVVVTPNGSSMWPLLRDGRDSVSLSRLHGMPRRGDVVLFVRENGDCVLHRVIAVKGEQCEFQGDGQRQVELVERGQILARMDALWRGAKQVRLSGLGYRLYVALWCGPVGRLLRPLLLRADRALWKRMHKQKGAT